MNISELLALGEQLRQTFADERRAIGKLDHASLVTLADTKRELVSRLSSFDPTGIGDPRVREMLELVRAEAQATALLVSTANAAVRMLLGYETGSYDRRARSVSFGSSRILASY